MVAKIIAFLVTLIANAAAGVAVFFGMLFAMNGYNGYDAEYGIYGYIALAIIVSLSMSSGAVILVHILLKREFSGLASALIAIPVFSVVGAGLKVVCSIIGIVIAEVVRVNF